MVTLSTRLEERDRSGDADVERLDSGGERDRQRRVAGAPDERPHALPLRAEDQGGAVREVDVPETRVAVGARGERPEPVALHLAEVAGEVRDDGDRQVLDCARPTRGTRRA